MRRYYTPSHHEKVKPPLERTSETQASTLDRFEESPIIKESRKSQSAYDSTQESPPQQSRKTFKIRSVHKPNEFCSVSQSLDLEEFFNTTCKLTDAMSWKPIGMEKEQFSFIKGSIKRLVSEKDTNKSGVESSRINIFKTRRAKTPGKEILPKKPKVKKIVIKDNFAMSPYENLQERIAQKKA
ncbi:unnamed protein product [Blepharisma stoltei]|uniref:Uncharacterized protein n=1 Tax=Blepharisma stoltei TaxID=1481888 RepID=A0AAU9JB56_9CILI|nr:unnamed protein product [Blepharisma stoltei]